MTDLAGGPREAPDEYERINTSVWLRRDQDSMISQIDSIILDIDGVIIDTTASFRVAISQTVQLYVVKFAGFKGDTVVLQPSETQLFKLAGGFNNDWDLASAAIMFYLTKAELAETIDTGRLREIGLTLEDFTTAAGRSGGGMHGAMTVLFQMLTKEQRERVQSRYDRKKIEALFQELYGGIDYCQRLYGFVPTFNKRKGLLNEERILLDKTTLNEFMPKVGVLTGRTKEETAIGLARASLTDVVPEAFIFFDGGRDPKMRKPQPGELNKLAERIGGTVTLYIGDVMDDLLVVKNANVDPAAPCVFLSAIIVNPLRRTETDLFMKEGADIVSLDVNKAIKAVSARRHDYE